MTTIDIATAPLRLIIANNNDNTTNGPASMAAAVLRLARREARALAKTDREAPTLEPYVPAPVPEIIVNVGDATIPVERDTDLTDDEKAAKFQRGLAIRQATAAQFYAAETVERASFYELLADERRGFTLTFGTEHSQTFAMDAATSYHPT